MAENERERLRAASELAMRAESADEKEGGGAPEIFEDDLAMAKIQGELSASTVGLDDLRRASRRAGAYKYDREKRTVYRLMKEGETREVPPPGQRRDIVERSATTRAGTLEWIARWRC